MKIRKQDCDLILKEHLMIYPHLYVAMGFPTKMYFGA